MTVEDDFLSDKDLDEEDYAIDFKNITPDEIVNIKDVLERDKALRLEENRRRKKVEDLIDEKILEISLKDVDDGQKFCVACGDKFRFWLNPRRVCDDCEKGMCNNCTYAMTKKSDRICYICYLKDSKELKTGKWFAIKSKQFGRHRRSASGFAIQSMKRIKPEIPPPLLHDISMDIPKSEGLAVNQNLGIDGQYKPIYTPRSSNTWKPVNIKDSTDILRREAINKTNDVVDSVEIPKIGHNTHLGVNNNHLSLAVSPPSGIPRFMKSNLETSKNLSSSSLSIQSETFESYKSGIPVSGDVMFAVFYDENKKMLNIYIEQCRNIAVADRSKRTTNPYVKTYLLPDKHKYSKKKTLCKNESIDPIFKETITYFIEKESLLKKTLSIAVWHKRLFSHNIFIGEVQILISDVDLDQKEPTWYPLQEKIY